ncbi:type II secretion system protein GspM [Methylohalobius crimeensis]|uniref:type II secretion system protein GspM n=1 Tax=Methylohalobius crimeensis TaxID=244365 RepID=UPI0003B4236F|nr:type II secretion system protein GspM [Methylohalobius crimeensis]
MMTNLTESQQRLAAWSLTLIPVLLFYFLLVAPYVSWVRSNQERISELQFQLERLSRSAAEEPSWRKRLKSLQTRHNQDEHYLSGETPALASAELQRRLGEIIRTAGGELTSTQVHPQHQEEEFTRIAVRIRLLGNLEVLREVLHSIESNRPLLIVDNLNIRPLPGRRDPKTRQPLPSDRLNMDMEVVGYMPTPTT